MLLQIRFTYLKPKYANKFKTKAIIVTIIAICNNFEPFSASYFYN
ncbi:hypothetical protein SA21201_0366 [Staphylococcus aureus subsp. aureus 21201]|nr:hypothetical protein SA21201_0366 [Staphylococcus aureus subsp. aureus 21201]